MILSLDPNSIEDYKRFLAIKSLPSYRFVGRQAIVPDEYADRLNLEVKAAANVDYDPPSWLYDYQRDIARVVMQKQKYCLFLECGLGKTAIFLEMARHCARVLPVGQCVLIVSPLMVIPQTIQETKRFYGDSIQIDHVRPAGLQEWLDHGEGRIGITNYEAIRPELHKGRLGGLILDESSLLKSHYGKWGTKLIEMGRGLNWKLACTGTPAPNDRIEYANHAVFMDAFPTVNSFLARFFVNKGQTNERWIIKPHALRPFYKALSHFCIFMSNPATYGWKDNTQNIPPIHVHQHHVELTEEQKRLAFVNKGQLFADKIGGITNRSVLSQIAKGTYKGKPIMTNKPRFIRELIESWPKEGTIVWCRFNAEQATLEKEMPMALSMDGQTPDDVRQDMVTRFKSGEAKVLISKPKILGFGLNLQIATRQVFSSCEDSYESYHQAVKRSNRIGSTRPLNVHLPVTDIERMQMENVLRKAAMVQKDTDEQESIFKEVGYVN